MLFNITANANNLCKSKPISPRAGMNWRKEGRSPAKAWPTLNGGRGHVLPPPPPPQGRGHLPVHHRPHQQVLQAFTTWCLHGGGGALQLHPLINVTLTASTFSPAHFHSNFSVSQRNQKGNCQGVYVNSIRAWGLDFNVVLGQLFLEWGLFCSVSDLRLYSGTSWLP